MLRDPLGLQSCDLRDPRAVGLQSRASEVVKDVKRMQFWKESRFTTKPVDVILLYLFALSNVNKTWAANLLEQGRQRGLTLQFCKKSK